MMTTLLVIWQSLSLIERVGVCALGVGQLLAAMATYRLTLALFQ